MTELHSSPTHARHRRSTESRGWREITALIVFGLIVVGAPLLFGAVDRWTQIGMLGLLMLGMAMCPPVVPLRAQRLLAGAVLLFAVAQLGPWGSSTQWRSVLQQEYGVTFPVTRHPEPWKGLDGLLSLAAALLWLWWARGLAAIRETRVKMAWILALAGVVVAAVCFATKGTDKIYGIRPTQSWAGWGPFPNRNHTASFLAMAALMTLGAGTWAVAKRRVYLATLASAGFALIVAALLMSKSRGGFLAFGVGLFIFCGAVIARLPTRQSRSMVLVVAALLGVLLAAFGGSVLERFTSQNAGLVSNELRRQIWSDAGAMWLDAPILGHGLGIFPEVFPIYTRHDFDGQAVMHPESSWLLWLTEAGSLFVLIGIAAFGVLTAGGVKRAWEFERRAFFLTSGALAGVGALLAHAAVDVPAHRWGTVIYCLALLAIAAPAHGERRISRFLAICPAGIAAYWAIPFLFWAPWAPESVARLDAQERALIPISGEQWEAVVRKFPLSVVARQYAGLAALARSDAAAAECHFAIARRLAGSSWAYATMQARGYGGRFPDKAIVAWQDAVLRSGRRSSEVLRDAVSESAGFRGFWPLWGQFVDAHPEYCLGFARAVVEAFPSQRQCAREFLDRRKERGPVSDDEAENMQVVLRWIGSPSDLSRWIAAHPERMGRDYRAWIRLYSEWGSDREAWEIYAKLVQEPALESPSSSFEAAESRYRAVPDDSQRALELAQHYAKRGEGGRAEDVVVREARRPDAPAWFLRKGAHILARHGEFAEAVALGLREEVQHPTSNVEHPTFKSAGVGYLDVFHFPPRSVVCQHSLEGMINALRGTVARGFGC